MSVKTQMHEARQLIADKRYTEARRLLRTVDHPQAALWLAKLDNLAPERKRRRRAFLLFIVAVLLVAAAVTLIVLNQMMNDMARQMLTLTAP